MKKLLVQENGKNCGVQESGSIVGWYRRVEKLQGSAKEWKNCWMQECEEICWVREGKKFTSCRVGDKLQDGWTVAVGSLKNQVVQLVVDRMAIVKGMQEITNCAAQN